ncbi:Hypothetical_protein [Hexamita inflata]|uniref:Hypothetical_protein n=1 Tax=Hexamita inflata TaxID=28002 RepID=A0ABP1H4Z2_9EUKA
MWPPSLRVQLQIFQRLQFLASASRKLRLCRAPCASRSASDKYGVRNTRATIARVSPEIEPTSATRQVSLCDLIRSLQIPPPRQPVRRVIYTLAIIGADGIQRGGGALKILKDSARYSDYYLTTSYEHAELRCSLVPAQTACLYKHSGACPTRCFHVSFTADRKSNQI